MKTFDHHKVRRDAASLERVGHDGVSVKFHPLMISFVAVSVLFGASCKWGWGATYSLRGHFRYEVQVVEGRIEAFERQLANPELKRFIKNLPTAEDLVRPLFREFEVEMDEACRWKITVLPVGNPSFHSFITQYDGENLFYYSLTTSSNLNIVMIENLDVPRTRTTAAEEIVWLAFASGCYFERATNGFAISLKSQRHADGGFTRYEVPIEIEVSESPPYLPMRVQYGSRAPQAIRGAKSKDDRQGVSQSTLAADFIADGLTNLDGLSFPSNFQYRLFESGWSTNQTDSSRVSVIIQGSLTNVSSREGGIDFRLPDRIAVSDHRVAVPTAIYVITNSVLPATNSSAVEMARERAAEKLRRQRLLHPRRSPSRLLMYSSAVLVLVAFPVYLAYRHRMRE